MPDDMSDLTAIRSELHDLRRQFHNLMSTVEIAVKGAQVVQQPSVSVQAPIQPTGSTGYTNDVIRLMLLTTAMMLLMTLRQLLVLTLLGWSS